ncbi:hypothetical protein GJV82_10075 [Cellulosimicrobium sp. BIT-GX5]|uniref:Uncharacterized protein n=1 Tax=Cellulosimicrobium composti TaxID=2672572 RepID=A0A6N7ZIY7_9MICO|nr:hypothetical protein [Cellulosimicrobium composti]MTG89290.1 hypothetical protein [Cellulosimicrobium composti]
MSGHDGATVTPDDGTPAASATTAGRHSPTAVPATTAEHHGPTAALAGTVPVPPVLVRDYQRLLRLFPYTYRRAHEAEMLGHLLDGARPGQSRPTRAERWDLVRAAAREWLLAPLGATERQRSSASVVVVVALTALLAGPATQAVVQAVLAGAADPRDLSLGGAWSAWVPVVLAVVAVPLAPAWVLWWGAVVSLFAGLRRTALVLSGLAAAAGVVAAGALVSAERASVAFQATGWAVALAAYVLAVLSITRRTSRAVGARAATATVWLTAAVLAASVPRSVADTAEEGVWVSAPGYPLTLAATVAAVVGAVAALVAVRPVRQAAPVLGGVLVALVVAHSDLLWSGALDTTAVDLGNVLGVVGLSLAATLVARWVVNRLDELAESRAAHRALIGAAGAGRGASRPGEWAAV